MVKDEQIGERADTDNDINLGTCLPLWTTVEDVESVEWLNRYTRKLWPRIDNFLQDTLINQVQPMIQSSTSLMESFCFSSCNLGKNPPLFIGIKTYRPEKVDDDKLMTDLQFAFNSNIDFGVSVGALSAGLCDLVFRGLMRLEFQPILPKPPFLGALSFSFVQDPIIDFDFKNLLNFIDFPGFERLLRGTIRSIVNSLLVIPNKITVKLDPESDISLLKHPFPDGVLRCHVLKAKNLIAGDTTFWGPGSSDPYVHIRAGLQEAKSDVIPTTLDPEWQKQCLEFMIMDIFHTQVIINVMDYDVIGSDDFLGKLCIPSSEFHEKGVDEQWRKLEGVASGEVLIKFEWLSLSARKEKKQLALDLIKPHPKANACILHIFIVKCNNLPRKGKPTQQKGLFKKLRRRPKCNESKVVVVVELETMEEPFVSCGKPFAEPVFECGFQVLIPQAKEAQVLFSVFADGCDQHLGYAIVDVVRLMSRPGMTEQCELDLMESGRKSTITVKMRLRWLVSKADGDKKSKK